MENGVTVADVDKKIDQGKEIDEILTGAPVKDTSSSIFNKILIAAIIGIGTIIVSFLDPVLSSITTENGKKTIKGHLITAAIVAIIALISLFVI